MAKPTSEVKTRFKMYKKGKLWLVAAAATAGMLAGGRVAQADTTTTNNTQPVVANADANKANTAAANSNVTLTSAPVAQGEKAQDNANVTPATSQTVANNTANQATATTAQPATNNQTPAQTVSMTSAAVANNTPQVNPQAKEVNANNHWYLQDQKGNNLTGFQKLNDNRTVYYSPKAENKGQMQYGLQNISNKTYYFDTFDGHMYVNQEAKINNNWYHFTNDGSASTGFTKLDNGKRTVYYNNQGQMQYGLQNISGKTYYFDTWNGNMYANREAKINNKWYNFTNNGTASTGFTKIGGGRTVYYNNQGQMQYGLQNISGKTYYFDTWNGNMYANREAKVNDKWYNFTKDGSASTGLTKINGGRTVYYNNQGQMQYGWQKINNQWHYFDTWNGNMYANREAKINDKWYNFTKDGVMSTGFTQLPGKTVYYNSQGQMQYGEQNINGKWFYFDTWNGALARGWYTLKDGRKVYYDVDANGNGRGMLHGEQSINGLTYYFNSSNGAKETGVVYNSATKHLQYYNSKDGSLTKNNKSGIVTDQNGEISLKDGENKLNNQWYYYDAKTKTVKTGWFKLNDGREVYYDLDNAQMVHGEKNINNSWYFFDYVNGAEAVSKFVKLNDGRTVYYDNQGHMVHGEKNLNGSWYFFDYGNGAEAISKFVKLNDGRTVYYDGQGHMVYKWQKINGNTYYFDGVNGAMYTGSHWIDGKQHNFASNGVEDTDVWGWPFAIGRGSYTGAQLFGVNAGGEFRMNGFHDGLDFGSIDHPGYEVHAVHSGKVTGIGYAAGLDWYVLIDTGEYLTVYQEAFASRSDIWVNVGQEVSLGQAIGGRRTSHLHLGITRQKNFNVALANSFNNNGTWINPLTLLGK